MIIKQLELGADKVFCYILACEETRKGVIIDPCGAADKLFGVIAELNLTILYIINTHCHPDHTCSNKVIKTETGALIMRHEADELLLQDPEAAEYFKRQGYPPSPPADKLVKDGDRLIFGNCSLRLFIPESGRGMIMVIHQQALWGAKKKKTPISEVNGRQKLLTC